MEEIKEDINPKINKDLNLESKPTIEKALILQKLLKELSFRKKAFNDTKEKMFSEINKNCYKYFEGRINVKRTFDYILNDSTKIYNNKYVLINDSKEVLKDLYEPLYNFYFLIQNDNSLLLKLIELSQMRYNEELSDFIVHFLYFDIINYSSNEDRLIFLIYLLLEKQVIKTLPDICSKDSFLSNIFKSLTRKIDVRKFLGSILDKNVLKIENLRTALTVDITEVNQSLNSKGNYLYHHLYSTIDPFKKSNNKAKKKLFESNIQSKFNKYIKDKNENKPILKRAKQIKIIQDENEYDNDNKEIFERESTNDNFLDDFDYIDEKGEIKDTNRQAMIFKKRKVDVIQKNKKKKKKKEEKNIWILMI